MAREYVKVTARVMPHTDIVVFDHETPEGHIVGVSFDGLTIHFGLYEQDAIASVDLLTEALGRVRAALRYYEQGRAGEAVPV